MRPSELVRAKRKEIIDLVGSYGKYGISSPKIFNGTSTGDDEEGDLVEMLVSIDKGSAEGQIQIYSLKGRLMSLLGVDEMDLFDENSISGFLKSTVCNIRPL